MLVLEKVPHGSRLGGSSGVMTVALPPWCAGMIMGTCRASHGQTCVWPGVVSIMYLRQEELLLQEEAASGIKCETWEEIKIPWRVSHFIFFSLTMLKKRS